MSSIVVCLTAKADRSDKIAKVLQDLTNRVPRLRFSSSLPGGFMALTMSLVLSRIRALEWYERFLFFGIEVFEADSPVWEGRVVAIRLTDQGVDVDCEGYWSNLADQKLYSWWSDNDMNRWLVPAAGGGSISDEISLSGAGAIGKFTVLKGKALFTVAARRNVSYSLNDKAVIYYRLPRVSNLGDDRLFQPNTIHSIQFTWDFISVDGALQPKVWTADFARGTWTERFAVPTFLTNTGTFTENLVADEVAAEAIAIGIDTLSSHVVSSDTIHYAFTNITIWAERDATTTRKTKQKKIITDLIKGNSDIGVGTHAKQINDNLSFVEDSELEIIPAVFEGETLQDIIAKLTSFGIAELYNLIENPGCEKASSTDGFKPIGGATVAQNAALKTRGSFACKVTTANVDDSGVEIEKADGVGGHLETIIPDRAYTFVFDIVTDAASKNMEATIAWYTSADALIGSIITQAFTPSDAGFTRESMEEISPTNADKVAVSIRTVSAQGIFNIWIDRVQVTPTPLFGKVVYLDGSSPGATWAGLAEETATFRLHPAIAGMFSRRTLHVKKRDEQNVRWRVSRQNIGGVELERSIQNYFTRVWTRFQDQFTGLVAFSDVKENIAEQEIIFSQRDTTVDAGEVLKETADKIRNAFAEDSRIPTQISEIVLTGSISNAAGVNEPLWRVRAGEIIFFHDLIPLSQVRPDLVRLLDTLRIFVIKEAEYDAFSNQLKLTLDFPPVKLDTLLASLLTRPSISTGADIAGSAVPITSFPGLGLNF